MAKKPRFKISLKHLPDFKLPVEFLMPDGNEAEVIFVVRHKSTNEVQDVYADKEDGTPTTDHEILTALVTGWDLEEEFNEANTVELVALFPGITVAFINAYMDALIGRRAKN